MINSDTVKQEFEKCIAYLRSELGSLRGTRATPALVEDIQVEVYGAKQQLKALASISVPDPRTINIEPWDKSIIKDIERAIINSGKGLNPSNEGNLLRVSLPPLTEESRKELVKIVHKRLEEARARLRFAREGAREQIIKAEKSKTVSEDEKFRQLAELDKLTGEYNDKARQMGEHKEREIMTV